MKKLRLEIPFLFLGDIACFNLALWLALLLRHQRMPGELFWQHLGPFTAIFFLWAIVFLIVGLYEKQMLARKKHLLEVILNAQLINSLIAVVFFYLASFPGIGPKTILVIYILISSPLIWLWRLQAINILRLQKKKKAFFLAEGDEAEELLTEVNTNSRYPFLLDRSSDQAELIVVDWSNPRMAGLAMQGKPLIDFSALYTDVFDRVPLSTLQPDWFRQNVSRKSYDLAKRLVDIVVSLPLIVVTLPMYAFFWFLIPSPFLIFQERIGWNGQIIRVAKIRTMRVNDEGAWVEEDDQRVTPIGRWLRKTHLDEIPQFFSVVKGDMSLTGPRPDIVSLGKKLESEISYYKMRQIVRPGLSGWGQIQQTFSPQSIDESKQRLQYDFYYIAYRSFWLDLKIIIRTIYAMLR